VYFLASSLRKLQICEGLHPYALIAVNEIPAGRGLEVLSDVVDSGLRVFLDSGIFNLTNEHARAHLMTMDEALKVHPTQLDGYARLYANYVRITKALGDRLWGYTELDAGGVAVKRETRKALEAEGLRPIPVFHALNDGWDYFHELAERYERICIGTLVQASQSTRRAIMHGVAEHRRAHPGLWVHYLGVSPGSLVNAYPAESCDSSTWLHSTRWASPKVYSDSAAVGILPDRYIYALGDSAGPNGADMALRLSAFRYSLLAASWADRAAEARGEDL
jgi:hypothetical protein